MKGKLKIVVIVFCWFGLFCCRDHSKRVAVHKENVFTDKILQQIVTFQDSRDSKSLFPYLKNKTLKYRKAAVLAFASIQDKSAVVPLSHLFEDKSKAIREAVAYALGQIKDKTAEPILLTQYEIEKSPSVKRHILEAIGKCGTEKGLSFVAEKKFRTKEESLLTGQAWGIYRFALRNIISDKGTARAVQLIDNRMPEKSRFIAANYLARARGIDLSAYVKPLVRAFDTEENIYTRMSLALAMGKAKEPDVLKQLKLILNSDMDCRIRVNAIRPLNGFNYSDVKDVLFKLLSDKAVNVAIAASEYFLSNGSQQDVEKYMEIAPLLPNWRPRTNMLKAALKVAPHKRKISNLIVSAYRKTRNIYERASLLHALGNDPGMVEFVESETFSAKDKVVGTYGLSALVDMRKNKNFDLFCADRLKKDKINLSKKFASIFRKAIEAGDTAMIGLGAGILRIPEMNFKGAYKNTDFLHEALKRCQLPEDIEAVMELQKTICFFEGKKDTLPTQVPMNNPINWKGVTEIRPDQRVLIQTSRGDITIQLMVNESPGSVSNFVRLIKDNFYKNSVIHRVVPNFVIQDGCPRGDGWGAPPFSIRSEFGPLYYREGSVGMASAGKDTEASQWFITHSPTPHLDGRYTIFATVVSGMDTVHRMEVGDKILGIKMIE